MITSCQACLAAQLSLRWHVFPMAWFQNSFFCAFKGKCRHYGTGTAKKKTHPLASVSFSVATRNLTMFLSRKEGMRKFTLKLVKARKKKIGMKVLWKVRIMTRWFCLDLRVLQVFFEVAWCYAEIRWVRSNRKMHVAKTFDRELPGKIVCTLKNRLKMCVSLIGTTLWKRHFKRWHD